MTLITAAMAVFLLNSSAPQARSTLSAAPAALSPVRQVALLGHRGLGKSTNRRIGRKIVASLDRARFFEDTRTEIYQENKKNPWEAFGLALLPTLFWKPLSIAVAWKYCDKNEDKRSLAFLTAVPTAGYGSYYSEWWWAGAVSTVGDMVGSAMLSLYFYNDHQTRNAPGGSMTLFYAGLGVSGFFWLFDMIMGPVGAIYFNRHLRKRYMATLPRVRQYVTPPHPEKGLADIGPAFSTNTPFVLGYSGTF